MCSLLFLCYTECAGPLKREENICKLAEIPYKQSSLRIPNPVVQFSELSDDEQENLKAQIEELKFEIHLKFLKFEADLVNSLRERITAADVVRTLLKHCTVYPTESMYNVSLLQVHRQALLDAKDIGEVFVIIEPFYTYYNYELLQTIVEVHGSEKDGERMQQYILDFSSYCRRVPCVEFYDDHGQKSLKRVKLKFKLDYDKKLLTLADIKHIERRISKILIIKSSVLFLHSVEEGCTAITFLVPHPCICAVLKALKGKSTTLQREVKMMTIECDGKPIDEVCILYSWKFSRDQIFMEGQSSKISQSNFCEWIFQNDSTHNTLLAPLLTAVQPGFEPAEKLVKKNHKARI